MSAFSPDFGMMVFLRALLGFASAGGGQGCVRALDGRLEHSSYIVKTSLHSFQNNPVYRVSPSKVQRHWDYANESECG